MDLDQAVPEPYVARDARAAEQRSSTGPVATVVPRGTLAAGIVPAMYRLYATHYADTDADTFARDLDAKTHVLLLRDGAGGLCGFSTLEIYVAERPDGAPIRVVYSGDTIIEPAHWGNSALAFEWLRFVGRVERSEPAVPLYWLLIVKGHRTYRFLSTFAKRYVPHHALSADPAEVALRDALAREKFGAAYDPVSGIARFGACAGRLNRSLAEVSEAHRARPPVAFFLARNPGYRDGDELVCLCELARANLKPLAQRVFAARVPASGS